MHAPYIPRGGEQSYPPPYRASDVHFYSFLLEADRGALDALCRKYLSDPTQGKLEFWPLVSRVLLAVADIRRFDVGSAIQQEFLAPEIDVAFWVPVVAVKRVAGIPVVDHFAWFLPYVFVNNPWALVSGRETYGFPKEMATFSLPSGPTEVRRVTVDTLTVERFGPGAPCQSRRLLEINRVDADPATGLKETWNEVKAAARAFFGLLADGGEAIPLPGPGLLVELFKLLADETYPTVFLKQFRHVAPVGAACYQAVVEGPTRITAFHGGGILHGDFALTVNDFASHPIVAELGLHPSPARVLLPTYLHFDFVLEGGTVLWEA